MNRLKRFAATWARRLFLALVVFVSLLTLFLVVTPQGKAALSTSLFVFQVLDLSINPQPWLTGDPVREEVTVPLPNGVGEADIYRVDDGQRRAAVLLFLGANAAGRDDPDVINLGNALARAGFVTMFHWSPTMALQHNIDPVELENLVWSFQYLAGLDFVDPDRVGLGGFCVGASFALVASADPRIRDDVQFVNAFGPYYDAEDLLLQVFTRSKMDGGVRVPWEPDKLTFKVVANELIETVEDSGEAEILTRVYFDGQPAAAGELEGLSERGRTVHRLLRGADLGNAESLYRSLPQEFRQSIGSISPSNHLDGIKARLMIMHDRDDRLVPADESRRLAAAFAGRGEIRHTEVLGFEHVRPTSGGGVWELLREAGKLYRHLYGIIRVA